MKCLLCEQSETMVEVKGQTYRYRTKEFEEIFPQVPIVFCNKCNLYQVDMVNNEVNDRKLYEYYTVNYRDENEAVNLFDSKNTLFRRGKGISRLISKYNKDQKVDLDIFEKGCGYGLNLI